MEWPRLATRESRNESLRHSHAMALDRGPRQSLNAGGDLVRETLPGSVGEGALMEIFALIGKSAPKEMLMDRPSSSAHFEWRSVPNDCYY